MICSPLAEATALDTTTARFAHADPGWLVPFPANQGFLLHLTLLVDRCDLLHPLGVEHAEPIAPATSW